MRLVLDIDKEKTIEYLETKLRKLISFLYSWITHDGEILGYILGVLHFMISIIIFILLSYHITNIQIRVELYINDTL